MQIEIHTPEYPLRNFVKSIICYTGYTAESKYEVLLPDGNTQLVIELDGNKRVANNAGLPSDDFESYKKSWVTGLQTFPVTYLSEKNATTISVQFEAGGLYALFNIPCHEFQNKFVDASLIASNEFKILREKILEKHTIKEKIRVIEIHLEAKIVRATDDLQLSNYIIKQMCYNNYSLAQVTDQINLSKKHIIQKFKTQIGTTPKQYQRVFRFKRSLELINASSSISQCDVAYKCNYYDQAHFINDFRTLSFKSPSEYLKIEKVYYHVLPLNNLR